MTTGRSSRTPGSRVDQTCRSWARSALAPWVLRSGSRSHARATSSSTAGGRAVAHRDGGGTSVVTCDQTTWKGTSPVWGWWPVSSSNRTMPAEYTSTRASTCPVRAVSGAMYSGVPSSDPVAVREVDAARARPKSVTLYVPSRATSTFSGLTSRWMSPVAWASVSASRTACMTSKASAGLKAPRSRSWSRRVRPPSSSIASHTTSPSSP